MEFEMDNALSLRNFLHLVFKRKTLILLVFAFVVIAVAAGTSLVSPTYEAKAQILVKIGRENVYTQMVPTGNQSPIVGLNREEQINSEIEILRSRSLIEKTTEAIGPEVLYKDLARSGTLPETVPWVPVQPGRMSPLQKAVLRLEKSLSVSAVPKSNVINIRLRHEDPQVACMALDKLIGLFLHQHIEVYKTPQSYKFFQEQSDYFLGRFRSAEDRLNSLKKEQDVYSLDETKRLLLSQESALRAEVDRTLSQIAETEIRIAQTQQQLANTPKIIPTEEEVDHTPSLENTLRTRLVDLELKEKDLMSRYTDENRLIRHTREELKIVRARLAEQEAKRQGRSRSGPNPTFRMLQEELLRSQTDFKTLKAKEQVQASQLVDYRERLGKLDGIEAEVNELQRRVNLEQQNYKLYLAKFEEARISEAMDTEKISNVTQIHPAIAPPRPVSPRVYLNLVLGLFLGALGSLGMAFLLESLGDRLETPDDTERALGLPVLASIPELKSRRILQPQP